MSGFVLVQTRVLDSDGFEGYRRLAGPSVSAHGGHFVVRGRVQEALEGGEPLPQLAVIAFASSEAARAWYHSAAYQEAVRAREGVAEMKLTLFC